MGPHFTPAVITWTTCLVWGSATPWLCQKSLYFNVEQLAERQTFPWKTTTKQQKTEMPVISCGKRWWCLKASCWITVNEEQGASSAFPSSSGYQSSWPTGEIPLQQKLSKWLLLANKDKDHNICLLRHALPTTLSALFTTMLICQWMLCDAIKYDLINHKTWFILKNKCLQDKIRYVYVALC